MDNTTGQVEQVLSQNNRIIQKHNLIQIKDYSNEQVEVMDIQGKLVLSKKNATIDLTDLIKGTYVINLKSGEGNIIGVKKVYVD